MAKKVLWNQEYYLLQKIEIMYGIQCLVYQTTMAPKIVTIAQHCITRCFSKLSNLYYNYNAMNCFFILCFYYYYHQGFIFPHFYRCNKKISLLKALVVVERYLSICEKLLSTKPSMFLKLLVNILFLHDNIFRVTTIYCKS